MPAPAATERLRGWQVLLELGLILLVAWFATQSLHNFSSQVQLSGVDMVELTRAADFAGQFLRSSGKIPLWDPFIGNGEPMLEATQAFILNPFMSLPIMLLGAKPGVLIVVLIHALLLGWGGWVWGRVLGFGVAGRLLMGTLLVSSGSLTGALSHGVFQLAMSQAYVPYVYAGLIAMLFLPGQRWGLVLFVTATVLLIFSGSFWYVLPTAFGCALIALLTLVRFRDRQPRLDATRIPLLLGSGILIVGVAAARLLTVNRDLLLHPQISYDFQLSFLQVFANYFDPHYTTDKSQWFALYHYVVPAPLMLALVALAIMTWRLSPSGKSKLIGGWRIVLAGILIVLIVSIFATGPTPLVNAIYDAIPLLKDWRNPGRMAAVASPWIVLAAAWCFDRLARLAWASTQSPRKWLGAGALLALGLAGAAGVIQIADNWPQSLVLIPTQNLFTSQADATHTLRQLYPSQMLMIHTNWLQHFTLNETLIRHPYGDNEVFTTGLPPTIGAEQPEYLEEFAFGDTPDSGNGIFLRENGYVEMPNVPTLPNIGAILDQNPEALPYAYLVSEQTLINQGGARLLREQTLPATYYHRIDQVEVEVENAAPGQVLVVQETAYPGWTVTLNGEPLPLESVHRRIAVRLPDALEHATVTFRYQPPRLYLGGLITILSVVLLIGYTLRLDQRLRRS